MKIIRTKQLARILSVSPVTIWRMSKRGELPPKIRISHRVVGWLEKDITKWLKDRQEEEKQDPQQLKDGELI